MELIVLYGGGGHGRDIAHDLTEQGHRVLGFYDDDPDRRNHPLTFNTPMICGANNPAVRKRIYQNHPGVAWLNRGVWVHATAYVGPGVELGRHVHVNANTFLTRCRIGKFTTISPGVTICGDVTIGSGCLIGAGATVKNFVRIGNDVTVGAGAVVVDHIPDGATVKGNPAR